MLLLMTMPHQAALVNSAVPMETYRFFTNGSLLTLRLPPDQYQVNQ